MTKVAPGSRTAACTRTATPRPKTASYSVWSLLKEGSSLTPPLPCGSLRLSEASAASSKTVSTRISNSAAWLRVCSSSANAATSFGMVTRRVP